MDSAWTVRRGGGRWRSKRTSLGWAGLAVALVAVAGCTREVELGEGPSRIALTAKSLRPDDSVVRAARRLRPLGKGEKRWTVTANWSGRQAVKTQVGNQVTAKVAVDEKERRFAVTGKFQPSGIREIELSWHCGGEQQVVFQLVQDGRVLAKSPAFDLTPSKFPQTQRFHPEWKAYPNATAERLELVFTGRESRVGLFHVSVADLSASFGGGDGAEHLWMESGEGRTIQWTGSEASLEGALPCRPNSVLSFSYGVPLAARSEESSSELRVTVTDSGGKSVSESYSLNFGDDSEPRWRDEKLALTGLRPGEAQLRFEVVATSSTSAEELADAVCAVGEVWMLDGTAPARPSVLFVTIDTVRADHIAALGLGVDIATPAVDAVAQRGVVFANCWSSTNTTNPSHAAMFTGLSPRDTGLMDQMTPLSEAASTLAEKFRAQGYATMATISARHLGPSTSGLGQGFDRFSWPPDKWERGADETLRYAKEWLAQAGEKPVFLWLHLFDAHFPYAPPREYDRRYYEGDEDPHDPARPLPHIPPALAEREMFQNMRDLEFERGQYKAEISYVDAQLRPYVEQARFRDGVIVIVADHGEALGEQNCLFDHADLTPSTLHVPLVMSWPNAPGGARSESPVTSIDIGRTLLSICGLETVKFPGSDLREYIDAAPKDSARFAVSANRAQASVTLGKWHLVLHLNDHFEPSLYQPRVKHQVELYDIAVDRECKNNLVDSAPADAKRLRAGLVTWLSQSSGANIIGERIVDDELAAGLKGLGYVDVKTGVVDLWVEDDCAWCQRFR